MDNSQVKTYVAASDSLLEWLRIEAARRGVINDITWDYPDMFRVDISLNPYHQAIIFVNTSRELRGLAVSGGLVRRDPLLHLDLGGRRIRRRFVTDRATSIRVMKKYLERLFADLDQASA